MYTQKYEYEHEYKHEYVKRNQVNNKPLYK